MIHVTKHCEEGLSTVDVCLQKSPFAPIKIYARDNKSGTFDTFKTLVLGAKALAPGAARFEDSNTLSEAVAGDRNGIGFIGLPYVHGAKALAVSEEGARALQATRLTVATEDYPLSRRLCLYTPANPTNRFTRKSSSSHFPNKDKMLLEIPGLLLKLWCPNYRRWPRKLRATTNKRLKARKGSR